MNLRPLPAVSTLVDLLRVRAAADPGRRGFTFLLDGERDEASLAYGELDRRARAIAAELRRHAAPGDRAVLLFAPGLDYIAAFFGCLYAGVIAVPVYPPDPTRLALTLPRLAAIFADAGVAAILTDQGIAALAEPLFAGIAALEGKRWVVTDALEPGLEAQWQPPAVGGDDVAFLQYTSGSTGTPKGVRVSHANLLDNLALIGGAFGLEARSTGVIWLPPYHDMGLIGGILEPLYRGFPVVLMSPIAFLQRPARWVEAVSRYRATCSGGPNFAFDLVVRKTTEAQRATLDLSTWDLAFCGAEPVRRGTFERFAAAFAPAGFRREAFYTCYGLAEGTLIVTGASKGAPPRFEAFDADALRTGAAEPTRDDAASAVLADCGAPLGDWRLAVVDPVTGEPRGPRHVGEIWIAGPSAARGYWGNEAASAQAFGATLPGDPSRAFLRTGDLGFVERGRLFVTGRLKDLLIVRGRNHYPHDVEASVERAHPLFRAGCGAAFTVDDNDDGRGDGGDGGGGGGGDGGERLVVVQEVERGYRPGSDPAHPDPYALATLARRAIAEGHGLHAYDVLLLPPNTVPKTSSGKVQRHACKLAYLAGALEPLGSARVEPAGGAGAARPPLRGAEAWLADALAALVGVEPARVDPDAPLTSYGLDSMQAVHLQAEIEGRVGHHVPLATLLGGASLREVAGGLPAPALPTPAHAPSTPPAPAAAALGAAAPAAAAPAAAALGAAALGAPSEHAPSEHAPSDGQRALWFLHRLAPESAAYNVCRAVRVRSGLDRPALRRAFQALVDRHPALRTTFPSRGGEPVASVGADAEASFAEVDAASWSPERLRAAAEGLAYEPFDLERGPLFSATLFVGAPGGDALVVRVHHIVTDFWSLAVLAGDLGRAYEVAAQQAAPAFAPPRTFADWADAQAAGWAGAGASRLAYWRAALGHDPPRLELATDRPRPTTQRHRGRTRLTALPPGLSADVLRLARDHGVTSFVALLSAVYVLLHRSTGQDDVVLGTPVAGRGRAAYADAVGYFADMMPLRLHLGDDPTFLTVMGRVKAAVVSGLDHQVPFVRLVEHLAPAREPGRSPLFQSAFAFQQRPPSSGIGLEAFAVEQPGATLRLGALELEALPLEQRAAQFDLSITMAESGGRLLASFEYDADLFDADSIARLEQRFAALLASAAAGPARRASALAWFDDDEREQVLHTWNDAAVVGGAPGGPLHADLSAQARRTPDAVAVQLGDRVLTYEQLERHANQLAHRLVALGVGPEALVAIHAERSFEAIVGVFGALKAGGAFLLLDPAHPPDRLAALVADARPAALVTHAAVTADLPAPAGQIITLSSSLAELADAPAHPPAAPVAADNLAYVIYTSGSTGAPKGVMVTHGAIANRIAWGRQAHPLGPDDAMLQNTSFSFDVALWEIFACLLSGSGTRLVLTPPGAGQDPARLAALIAEQRVTTVGFVPSVLRWLADEPRLANCTSLKHVFAGGEALTNAVRERVFERLPGATLYNLYGLCETTIDATHHACERDGDERTAPIGRPIGNARAYVLDAAGAPVPPGVPGELFIGGAVLARGYLGRPGLTAERFLPDPFASAPGARMYRTGDRARWRPDGALEFLGRRDHQVKLRGARVELGEVEALVRSHPGVREAAVVLWPADLADDPRRLLALLEAAETLGDAELHAHA